MGTSRGARLARRPRRGWIGAKFLTHYAILGAGIGVVLRQVGRTLRDAQLVYRFGRMLAPGEASARVSCVDAVPRPLRQGEG